MFCFCGGGGRIFCLYFVAFINVLLLLFLFCFWFFCLFLFFVFVFERWKEMFYLTTHSTPFVYGYMALGIL